MRRDFLLIFLIAAVACAVRVYPAWETVFGGADVNFLETDAWYHVRLAENQVRNYPWRVALDPYAAPGGQFVPIAPLFDTIVSTIVVVRHGRNAGTDAVARVAAVVPPVLGTLTVVAVWALGRRLWERRAGLLAAALLAILPGHFMDRTMLGFVDHHALEALLAIVTMLAIVRALQPAATVLAAVLAGLALGLYLLAWGSGAFLVGILGAWAVLLIALWRSGPVLASTGRVAGIAAVVAVALVVLFQDARMHRFGSQIIGLTALAGIALVARLLGGVEIGRPRTRVIAGGIAVVAIVAGATAWVLAPGLVRQFLNDVQRLAPDPTRMAVLEARPLFLYPGVWNWHQPWQFFRTGFFVGLVALFPFAAHVWRHRQPGDLLVWVFAVSTFIATIGQNRFGYYLVTACALLGGWLAARILDWGGIPHALNPAAAPATRLPLAREIAVTIVAGAMFAPNLAPAVLLAKESSSLTAYWQETMTWLRRETPPPFLQSAAAGDDYYFARYPQDVAVPPDYSVMNWWDQGYWLVQKARRVPVSNPTQERAPNAARFYAETDERRALEILRSERTQFVLSDWELPFRLTADGAVMGRFQNVLDWAGAPHADYYGVYYRRDGNGWTPLWVFHEPYYRSMAYRLAVLGGAAGVPANDTTVITVADRVDPGGVQFREVLTLHTYATYEAAQAAAAAHAANTTMIVGLDPWQPAFPLAGLSSIVQRHAVRTPEQAAAEAPWVRIFEIRRD
jgi:dolichyl-diphosphooligosaccharide--protein glycosyltransferase